MATAAFCTQPSGGNVAAGLVLDIFFFHKEQVCCSVKTLLLSFLLLPFFGLVGFFLFFFLITSGIAGRMKKVKRLNHTGCFGIREDQKLMLSLQERVFNSETR